MLAAMRVSCWQRYARALCVSAEGHDITQDRFADLYLCYQ